MAQKLSLGLTIAGPYLLALLLGAILVVTSVALLRGRLARWLSQFSSKPDPIHSLADLSLLASVSLLVFLVALELIPVAGFSLGLSISRFDFLLALLASAVMVLAAAPRVVERRAGLAAVIVLTVSAILLVCFLVMAGHFYDLTWDGNTAHQVAVVMLADGWNPIQDPHAANGKARQWIALEHFAKGAWIRGASVYAFTGRLEQAKVSNLLLVVATFAVWFSLLLTMGTQSWVIAVVGAALVALNPISVVQALTFLVDGQLASLVACLIGLGALLVVRPQRWPGLIAFGAALIMLSTVKFTGLVYAIEITAMLAMALVLCRASLPTRRITAAGIVAALAVAVFFAGFNPYVVNTVEHRSPMYPLAGTGSVDIMSNNQPANLARMNRFEKLGTALFSKARALSPETPASSPTELKVPFTFHKSEVRPYLDSQTHIAGFGPWFSGALLLVVCGLITLLIDRRTRSDPRARAAVFVCVVLVATALSNPEAWWARYAPQLWLVPVIVGVTLIDRMHADMGRRLGIATLSVLLLNVGFVGAVNAANSINGRREISQALDIAAAWPHGALLQQREFETSWVKLNERGIRCRIVSDEASIPAQLTVPYLTAGLSEIPDRPARSATSSATLREISAP